MDPGGVFGGLRASCNIIRSHQFKEMAIHPQMELDIAMNNNSLTPLNSNVNLEAPGIWESTVLLKRGAFYNYYTCTIMFQWSSLDLAMHLTSNNSIQLRKQQFSHVRSLAI